MLEKGYKSPSDTSCKSQFYSKTETVKDLRKIGFVGHIGVVPL